MDRSENKNGQIMDRSMDTTREPSNLEPRKKAPKTPKFIPPTESEVTGYFISKGYKRDIAKKAFEYYNTAGWKDSRGQKVRNWKQKMIAVWFKEENKVPPEKVRVYDGGPRRDNRT
jgi:hypothetical protein